MENSGDKCIINGFDSSESRTTCSNSSSWDEYWSSPGPLGWPIRKAQLMSNCSDVSEDEGKSKTYLDDDDDDYSLKKMDSSISEMEMMKERFAKLLLGEDMSGNGKGVCTALAISNAITNLCATAFGQLWRLEPLACEKKQMWQREMECLTCVSNHIVELIPSWQTFHDGSKLEVMKCRPRSDIFINLPALRKLDNMLLEILDSFVSTEFWYVDQRIEASGSDDGSASFCKPLQRQQEKWWLPVPRVPAGGLQEVTRKQLNHKRECANQILKAAMAINDISLSEMEVPESYLDALPKNGRACLGDVIYHNITSEKFSSECLLEWLDVSSEHTALEIANRVEASIYMWRRRLHSRPLPNQNRSTAKASWEMVKELMADGFKTDLLVERAESLLLCLKHRFPGLTQTSLDTTKIQCNKDVGKSILESYSRVLESLAFNIVARIDDLLFVDNLTRNPNNPSSTIAPKRLSYVMSPYRTAFGTPKFSHGSLVSPTRGVHNSPHFNVNKPPRRGFGVKRALTNYLGGDTKVKSNNHLLEGHDCLSTRNTHIEPSRSSTDGTSSRKENRTPSRIGTMEW